ncbi:unnamed protein product [Brassica rapa subsp. narinosa]
MKDRESDGSLDNRIFLQDTFHRYGNIIECQIMVEKDTGRQRGFGFITFSDRQGADDAIKHMHGRELGGRVISVNNAEPKAGRGGAEDECFKCGGRGHWARECPSTGGDRGRYRDPSAVRSRVGSYGGHRDCYDRDRYMDNPRDGRQYSSYRDCFEGGGK